jgi:hypothetical protein
MGHKHKGIFYLGLEKLHGNATTSAGAQQLALRQTFEDIINRQACGEELPYDDETFVVKLKQALDFLTNITDDRRNRAKALENNPAGRKMILADCAYVKRGITYYRKLLSDKGL